MPKAAINGFDHIGRGTTLKYKLEVVRKRKQFGYEGYNRDKKYILQFVAGRQLVTESEVDNVRVNS